MGVSLTKLLGPNIFNGNILKSNENQKLTIVAEVAHTLHNYHIYEYLREGKLVSRNKRKYKLLVDF